MILREDGVDEGITTATFRGISFQFGTHFAAYHLCCKGRHEGCGAASES